VRRARSELAIVRDAVGEELGDRELEGDREDVEAGEHVLDRRLASTGETTHVARAHVDEVEDPLLVELVGVVELARDDAPAVPERVNEGVDEGLIVEAVLPTR